MDTKGAMLDDIYAYGLSRTLIQVAPPATVGLYSPCQKRSETLLQKIRNYMNREAEWREKKHKEDVPTPTFLGSLFCLFAMIFLRPVWTEEGERRRKRVRWIFVRFSAWHFAGSDKLWAGLVLQLFKAVNRNIGGLFVSVYRVTQYPFPKRVESQSQSNWRQRKVCGLPVWLVTLVMAAVSIGSCVLLSVTGFRVKVNGTLGGLASVESMAIATLGAPAAIAVRFIVRTAKNVLFNQGSSIQSKMNKSAISEQMGFMDKVRKEVGILVDLIHFMEVIENRKIRVILEITNLDRCGSEKIIQALEVINILLTGESSPFVSILAIDPRIVVNCVENTPLHDRSENSGYEFLNNIVTLPFSVPELGVDSKLKVFKTLAESRLEVIVDESKATGAHTAKLSSNKESALEKGIRDDSVVPFIGNSAGEMEIIEQGISWEYWANQIKALTNDVLEFVYTKGSLQTYIVEHDMHMRRIINSIRMSVVIKEGMIRDSCSAEEIAAWVVLANMWPCRLSWILHIVEDDQQRAAIDHPDGRDHIDNAKTLWEVFSESSIELHALRDKIVLLFEQDSDPDLFERFLKIDFRFTIRDIGRFMPWTVNLDQSIKKELDRIRESYRMRHKVNPKALTPLPIRAVIGMSTDDICKEMQKLNFPETHQKLVRENRLDGASLALGDDGEIKRVLQMALGEWISFSFHFLGGKPRSSPLTSNTMMALHSGDVPSTLLGR
ncbi:NTPase KAP family P-loop domain-containing protein 1-like [Megalops cyprinoides]|uniref:NTPase KAP family P-loop domain-containing protein 1-like n=1 Tax=Megalops cyprinoides TaxID=118141 RepID=UPI001863E397|nr:NTPase KAP family P-loop domain-containing protein 1-like [Megalops cyprinoides]